MGQSGTSPTSGVNSSLPEATMAIKGNNSEGVVTLTLKDYEAILSKMRELEEKNRQLEERNLGVKKPHIAGNVVIIKRTEYMRIVGENKKLRRPRVTVDVDLDTLSPDRRKSAVLSYKLLELKTQGKLGNYVRDTMGRYAKHPDFWIVQALEPLIKTDYITREDLLLALMDPGVWYKADEKLHKAKAKRNTRGSESEPLQELKRQLMAK